jgi:hypothetical protein
VWWSRYSASGGEEEAGAAGIGGGGRRRIWGRRGEAGLEVGDGADGWAPSVSERERREVGPAGDELAGRKGKTGQALEIWADEKKRKKNKRKGGKKEFGPVVEIGHHGPHGKGGRVGLGQKKNRKRGREGGG